MPENPFPPLPEDEVRSFLATIHEDPHDEARRLIFADWLDEHGDPRAEMIRLSIEAYHVTAENPRVKEIMDQWRAWGEYGEKMQAWLCQYANESNDIEVTTSRLGLLHATIWGNDESPPREAKEAFEAAWRQGWFESAEFRGTPNALAKKTSLRVREFVLSLPSVETYAFGDHIDDDDLVGAAEIPNLVGIFLEARDGLTDAGLAELCNHPRLESLGISGGRFTREGLIHLATIPRLRSLYMEQFFNLDDEALSRLANMKTLESVRLPKESIFRRRFLAITFPPQTQGFMVQSSSRRRVERSGKPSYARISYGWWEVHECGSVDLGNTPAASRIVTWFSGGCNGRRHRVALRTEGTS